MTRSAYGPGWSEEANRRRLEITRGITARSIRMQTTRAFEWVVLLHRDDPLLAEREAVFEGATFIYTDDVGSPDAVAFRAYGAGWAQAIGPRNDRIAMTRLDDDDALAPWVMERVALAAARDRGRAVLMLPLGIRVWRGGFTVVRHMSNAMHTLVTPPGDALTVYDYGHRKARKAAPTFVVDKRPAWLWSRHDDTLSGWKVADAPLVPEIRALFPIDWSLLEGDHAPRSRPLTSMQAGRAFR